MCLESRLLSVCGSVLVMERRLRDVAQLTLIDTVDEPGPESPGETPHGRVGVVILHWV